MITDPESPEIFFVIGSLNIGGTEMHLSLLAPELVKCGFKVTLYNLSGNGVLGDAISKAGAEVAGPFIRSRPGGINLLKVPILALSALKLFFLFLFRRPRIVHFFLPEAYIIGAIMARCAGLSSLVMSRRSLNVYQESHPLLSRLERKLHCSMHIILANSKRVLEQLHDLENVPAEKLGLIYNGVRLDAYDTPFDREKKRRELGIGLKTKALLSVANLIPYKGHADLLQALSEIKDKMPRDWVLLLVGRDDGIGESLKRLATESGIEKHVVFLGPRDDVTDLFRMSDLALLTSHEEGFSNVILEGMAAGLPLVVTDVGGNPEAVLNGKTGLVVPARDPSALGEAILHLVRNPADARRMGRAGYLRAKTDFTLQACVTRYRELYDAVAANRPLPKNIAFRPR